MTMPTIEEDVCTIQRQCSNEDAAGTALLNYARRAKRAPIGETPEEHCKLVKLLALEGTRKQNRSLARNAKKEPMKAPLTGIALEIYNLHLEGASETEIGERLCVGINTVRSALKSALRKENKDLVENDVRALRTPAATSGLDAAILDEDKAKLDVAIKTLPARCQNVVRLVYFEGVSQVDAATQLNLTKRQVEVALNTALDLLRAQVTE